nr:hypothetical protein [Desulfobulbaceae bacterium]
MIQDFSSIFEGKQTIDVRTVSFRRNTTFRKVAGAVLTTVLVIGVISCLVFGLLIKSGLKELALKQTVKLELIIDQQRLYAQRNMLLEKDKIVLAAAGMGLHSPKGKQVRQL